jgi:hypothetical protein
MEKVTFIPANPGFFVIDDLGGAWPDEFEDGFDNPDFWVVLEPVVAWAIWLDEKTGEIFNRAITTPPSEGYLERGLHRPILRPDGLVSTESNTEDSLLDFICGPIHQLVLRGYPDKTPAFYKKWAITGHNAGRVHPCIAEAFDLEERPGRSQQPSRSSAMASCTPCPMRA